MTPHFLIWSFGPKIGSVDRICHQTDSINRFYLDVKTGPYQSSALAVDEHEHSPARMRYTKFVHYVQNYREIPHRCCCLLAAKILRL